MTVVDQPRQRSSHHRHRCVDIIHLPFTERHSPLTEHHEMRWLVPSEISSLDWALADRETVRLLSTMNLARK